MRVSSIFSRYCLFWEIIKLFKFWSQQELHLSAIEGNMDMFLSELYTERQPFVPSVLTARSFAHNIL